MKVKIIKSQLNSYWYNQLIGCEFEVKDVSNINYMVVTAGFGGDYYISKEDCEIIPEEYTYLDIDLPEWWDGRPIYGEAWDTYRKARKAYCCGISPQKDTKNKYLCFIDEGHGSFYEWLTYFEPLPKQQTSAKVVITKDGNTTEVELTADQIERLGIK